MARKGHKKSRDGCTECKRRHVKCDELRPVCRRCTLSSRQCLYEATTQSPVGAISSPQDRHMSDESTTSNAQSRTASTLAQDQREQHSVVSPPTNDSLLRSDENFIHLELFYNFEHSTCRTIARTESEIDQYRRAMISRAFQRPFLMHAMLALSALQIALERPDQAAVYRHTSAVLQANAFEGFDSNCLRNVNESNALDVLLFQHVTALYVFCDLFNSPNQDFGEFLDQVVGCIRLLRGVDTVISTWWAFLSTTEIGQLMRTSNEHQENCRRTLGECDDLKDAIETADLSDKSIRVCLKSISTLQAYFDAENSLGDEPIESTNMLFAWLITASLEFTELLDQRKPEALVILAYYAVLLHRRRRSWAVADAGQRLLKQIISYLGKKWEEQLTWPIQCIMGVDYS